MLGVHPANKWRGLRVKYRRIVRTAKVLHIFEYPTSSYLLINKEVTKILLKYPAKLKKLTNFY